MFGVIFKNSFDFFKTFDTYKIQKYVWLEITLDLNKKLT